MSAVCEELSCASLLIALPGRDGARGVGARDNGAKDHVQCAAGRVDSLALNHVDKVVVTLVVVAGVAHQRAGGQRTRMRLQLGRVNESLVTCFETDAVYT